MPALSSVQLLVLIGGILVATLLLGTLLAVLMVWLTREVQGAYGQAPAAPAKASASTAKAPVPSSAAPAQSIGPWPFVISGLALLVVLGVIVSPISHVRGASPEGGNAHSTSSAAAGGTALAGDPVQGKEKFESTCASCHGVDAKGLPGLGKDLTTSAFVRQQTDAELLEFIKRGRPATDPANTTGVAMPPRGGNPSLTDQDLINIIAFIRTFNPHQP